MRWLILLFMFFGLMINFADKSILGFAAEPIMKEFNLTYSQWGIVGSSFFWLFSIAGVVGGAWSDRIGTKKALTFLLFSWTVLQFGAFAISGLPLLILYRILLGVGEGPHGPISMSQLSKWFHPNSRGLALSIFNGGAIVGAVILAPIFVVLIEDLGWRGAFASTGILSVVWAVLWMWLGKEKPAKVEWDEPVTTQSKFKWSEVSPIIFSRSCLLTLFLGFSAFGALAWTSVFQPLYFGQILGLTNKQIGLASVAVGVGGLIISIFISKISDNLFKKSQSYYTSRVVVGGVCLIVAALGYFLATIVQSNLLILGMFILSAGCVATITSIVPQIMIKLFPTRRGFGISLGTSFQNIAGIIGPIVIGLLINLAGTNKVLGFHYALFYIGGLMLIAGLLFILFCRPDESSAEAAQPTENAISF
ncbi:MFS transporter [Neobacillus niacini]|uniref:MFS transporter n=1 Tax=Neobacillus niacini TaxID=86668 RepID=UPI002FFE4676